MRALRLAVLAALVSVSVVESSTVFAKGAAGGAAGGASGGGSSGGGAGGGDGGRSSGYSAVGVVGGDNQWTRVPPQHERRRFIEPARAFSSCFKQDQLFDRYGYAVVNLHGAECFGQ